MKQSNVIFFFLIVGFLVFVTLRGELPKYLAVLGIGEGSAAGQAVAGVVQGSLGMPATTPTGQLASGVNSLAGAGFAALTGNPTSAVASAIGAGTALGNVDMVTV